MSCPDCEKLEAKLKRAERTLRDCGGLGAGQARPSCGHEKLRDDCIPCLIENVRRCSYWEGEAKNERNEARKRADLEELIKGEALRQAELEADRAEQAEAKVKETEQECQKLRDTTRLVTKKMEAANTQRNDIAEALRGVHALLVASHGGLSVGEAKKCYQMVDAALTSSPEARRRGLADAAREAMAILSHDHTRAMEQRPARAYHVLERALTDISEPKKARVETFHVEEGTGRCSICEQSFPLGTKIAIVCPSCAKRGSDGEG